MAGDTVDGCISSKMSTPEQMEDGTGDLNDASQLASQQDASSQVNPMNVSSQDASSQVNPMNASSQNASSQVNPMNVSSHEASSQLTAMTQDQSQPNTQPLEMESVAQALNDEVVWGQLYPQCGAFPRISLTKDVFSLGRASSCDYMIKEKDGRQVLVTCSFQVSVRNT